jgi:hypothetical protein
MSAGPPQRTGAGSTWVHGKRAHAAREHPAVQLAGDHGLHELGVAVDPLHVARHARGEEPPVRVLARRRVRVPVHVPEPRGAALPRGAGTRVK